MSTLLAATADCMVPSLSVAAIRHIEQGCSDREEASRRNQDGVGEDRAATIWKMKTVALCVRNTCENCA